MFVDSAEQRAVIIQRAAGDLCEFLEQILYGPSTRADGSLNFVGALKRAMSTTGYAEVKDLQRAQVVVSPYSAS